MLDIKLIRENPEAVRENIEKRNLTVDLDTFLELDKEKLDFIVKVDALRETKNKVSKEIPTLPNEEKAGKNCGNETTWRGS